MISDEVKKEEDVKSWILTMVYIIPLVAPLTNLCAPLIPNLAAWNIHAYMYLNVVGRKRIKEMISIFMELFFPKIGGGTTAAVFYDEMMKKGIRHGPVLRASCRFIGNRRDWYYCR